ncbi:MAG TPA: GNAT family N-acetyltransferase [Mycobacteriales bacterium]|nr:GNAT family N-acetyltransferase [Mycobacteriales bacterium]
MHVDPIETERLTLVSLSPALIDALVAGDLPAARDLAAYDIEPETFADDGYVLARRQAQLAADPTEQPWLLRAAVLRNTRTVVGRVGFHGPPDASGSVEVGYTVAPEHRGRGLATEMAAAMFAWAAAQGAQTVVASVRPDNGPSLAVVAKLGFVQTGEQIDEIDGLEFVFARPVASGAGSPGSQGGFA